jgi:hypothetical protein
MINRSDLLKDLQRELHKIEKDILVYSESKEEFAEHLQEEYEKAQAAGRTAEHFVSWREAQITQAAVAWLLTCVFVRFLEDNNLLVEPMLSGPATRAKNGKESKPLQNAKERMVAFFNENPTLEERDYLLDLFAELERFPIIAELLDHRHNPLWQIPVSSDGAKGLIDFFQKIDADSGEIIHDFTDADWDTRFLGDLYQDLSESVRKRYALLQTPEFVESFILDYTLEKAKDTFGLPGLRLIDPTCGSGHFLLTTFERMFDAWQKREPATNARELAQRALDVVHGVDINPYAIAICRFRLFIAAMKAAGSYKVKDAPDFHFNLACGDSLLHGRRFEWQGQGLQSDLIDEDPIKHVLEVEDKDKLLKILGQQYHAVVGNPPYIIVRDKALNQAYRDRYLTCHRKYSLGVPFTERFFELTVAPKAGVPAGFMGMITSNSFMKREFGTKIIGDFLSRKNITHIIDCSGAFIPGHGTPTVIIFAKNEVPVIERPVRVAMGIRAEPSTPKNPEEGKVWSSIVSLIEKPGAENDFLSVEDKDRGIYSAHPWSLTGGGSLEVKEKIESGSSILLADLLDSVGFGAILGEDEAFGVPSEKVCASGLPSLNKVLIEGELVRDWAAIPEKTYIFPYDESIELIYDDSVIRWLWPLKTVLWSRATFGKKTYKTEGRPFFEFHQIPKERNRFGTVITFAEVASHNHFLVSETDKLFNRTAPIMKLRSKIRDDYFILCAALNTSVSCFYMKQICQQKQLTGGDGVRVEFISKVPYQFSGTALKKIPLPSAIILGRYKSVFLRYSKVISDAINEISTLTPSQAISISFKTKESIQSVWVELQLKIKKLRGNMMQAQEEIDWISYCAYGLCDESVLVGGELWPDVALEIGERPFEISSQINQDGFEVPKTVPVNWPDAMRVIWLKRIAEIKNNRDIRVIENPNYKRRWIGRQGLFNKSAKSNPMKSECMRWMLALLEDQYLKSEKQLITCASLADKVRVNDEFIKIASYYKDGEQLDIQKLVCDLVTEDSIPQIPAARYKQKAMPKFRAWQETWGKQRQEDAIDFEFGVDKPLTEEDAVNDGKVADYNTAKAKSAAKKTELIGDIPTPPKYVVGDFRKPSYWPLRGKLDVPKERFFSLPGCEKDGDTTLVIGWAGMNHLQRATAIATWYLDRKETDGWEAEKLKPMLVALDELIPWLKQWHNEIDPEFGEHMGDYYEGFLSEEMRMLDVTKDDLLAWEPPAAPKKKAVAKKKMVVKKAKSKKDTSSEASNIDTSKEQG